ncbi:hypothetical protein ACF0H5_003574 [Mactra antiquata]
MDIEVAETFDISYIKARAKNLVEGNILCKEIRRIDRQFRRSLMRIESGINEEKRFVKKLKSDANDYKEKDKTSYSKAEEKFLKMEKRRKRAYISSKMGKKVHLSPETFVKSDNKDEEMSVMGEKVFKPVIHKPKMYFWSQDASTKLAVMTSFYGYQLNVKRSMTEVKLLGQQMYPDENRAVQSADPVTSRNASSTDIRRAKTSVPINISDDEFFYNNVVKHVPPPTPKMLTANDLRTRENSFLNDPKSRENSFVEIYINGIDHDEHAESRTVPVSRNTVSRAKTSSKTSTYDLNKEKMFRNDSRPKTFSTMQESPIGYIEKSSPEKIHVDMKNSEKKDKEKLPILQQRSVGTANGVVRPTKRPPGIMLKTRGEVTRQNQENMSNRSDDQGKTITDLERSYSDIPVLMTEINKLKTSIEFMPKPKSGSYSKSTFGLNMQNAIKKKVFTKSGLPTPFKKNHNTMLKHYGTPLMEQKAPRIHAFSVSVI